MIEFIYNDGGREAAGFKGHTRDCVTRAIAIVTDKPYKEVYDDINNLSKDCGKELVKSSYGYSYEKTSSARTGVQRKIYDKYLKSLGYKWIPTMFIGKGCKVHLKADELPKDRLIVRVSKHLTAVIDGVVNDTVNPAREIHVSEYKNGNQLNYIQERCVYGYYIKE
jgi:hypothetical protein